MWQSGSKCSKIGALVNVNCKGLKADLALGVSKLGPAFLASKLGEFSLFDGFLNIADFLPSKFPDLDNFWLFDLSVFGFTRFDLSFNLLLPSPILPTVKWSTFERALGWTRRECSAWTKGHVQRLRNSDMIAEKVCIQLFSLRWKSGQCVVHFAVSAAMIMWGEEQYAITI